MKRFAFIVASIGAMLGLSGCLQNEVTVTVKADGSGTVVEETVLGAQVSAMLGGLGGLGAEPGAAQEDPLDEMFGEDKAKEKAGKMGEGVTLVGVEKIDRDGKKGARVTYAFEDINKLKLALDSGTDALEEPDLGMPGEDAGDADADAAEPEEEEESDPIRFQFADGKLTVIMPQPDEDAAAEDVEIPEEAAEVAKDPQAEAMAQAMFADMKMAVRLVIEPGIASTDATHVEGNKITLMEMNFGELMKDAQGMRLLDQMEDKKPEELAEMLEGIKGVKFESKEKFTVEMK